MAGYSKSVIKRLLVDSASYAITSTSASYALTASYALNSGGGPSTPTFPYTGSVIISGSLIITGSFLLDQTLTYFSSVTSSVSGDNNLFILNTGSYKSAFGKYTLYSSSNARAGEFITVWNGGTVRYYDNSTTDIGDTSTMMFYSIISSEQIYIISNGGTGWTVKMLTTFI